MPNARIYSICLLQSTGNWGPGYYYPMGHTHPGHPGYTPVCHACPFNGEWWHKSSWATPFFAVQPTPSVTLSSTFKPRWTDYAHDTHATNHPNPDVPIPESNGTLPLDISTAILCLSKQHWCSKSTTISLEPRPSLDSFVYRLSGVGSSLNMGGQTENRKICVWQLCDFLCPWSTNNRVDKCLPYPPNSYAPIIHMNNHFCSTCCTFNHVYVYVKFSSNQLF